MERIKKALPVVVIIVLLGLVIRLYIWEPNLYDDQIHSNFQNDNVEVVTINTMQYDFFAEYRLQREISRSKEIDLLKEMINNENYDGEVRKSAQLDLLSLIKKMEKEFDAENLIRAKGVKDSIVMISDGGVNVIINVDGPIEQYIPKIGDATARATGRRMEEITIIPY